MQRDRMMTVFLDNGLDYIIMVFAVGGVSTRLRRGHACGSPSVWTSGTQLGSNDEAYVEAFPLSLCRCLSASMSTRNLSQVVMTL
jgi:hypothetical protein